MPVRPPVMTFECVQCGWFGRTAPKSDVVVEGFDIFTKCPKCGSENVRRKAEGPISATVGTLKNLLRQGRSRGNFHQK